MIPALTEHQTIIQWEIIYAKLVTPLAKPVLEILPINALLVLQIYFFSLILVMILVLMEVLTIIQWAIIFAKPAISLARHVLK
jgi:hypothetical protein